MRKTSVVAAFAVSLLLFGPLVAAKPMPMDLLGRVKYGQVLVSPTGRHLAVTHFEGDDSWLSIYNMPEKTAASSFNIGDEKEFARVDWVSDTHVVIGLARKMFRDVKRVTGEINSINAETGKIENIGYGAILHTLPDDPKHILISASADQFNEVYRLNVLNGTRRRVARGPVPRGGFVTSTAGDVLFAYGEDPENKLEVYQRVRQDWELVETFAMDEQGWRPFAEGPLEDTVLTWDSRGSANGTRGLGLYNMQTREHTLVFRVNEVDLSQAYRDLNNRVYAVRSDHHFPAAHYLSQTHPLARIRSELAKSYPDEFITFTSASRDNMQAVAFISGDRNPGEYVLVDLEQRTVERLFTRRPDVNTEVLAEMSPVEVTARDGTTIYGYVTSAADTPRPGPMIVYLHGGPHGVRDYWGFDPQVQLMASHGAHVLQVNYRGSGGYGIDYEAAGYGEWGGLMQDDVTDATRWAIQHELADPERICIYGASFGAYSALMGAAREPDLYRCAVGYAGIYDLTAMDSHGDVRERKAGLAFIRNVIGRDDEFLRSRSPVHLAERIKASVLLVHGAADRRAPLEHAERMRDALNRHNGKTTGWLVDHLQGHGFAGVRGRVEVYQQIADFMAPHLGLDPAADADQSAR